MAGLRVALPSAGVSAAADTGLGWWILPAMGAMAARPSQRRQHDLADQADDQDRGCGDDHGVMVKPHGVVLQDGLVVHEGSVVSAITCHEI